MSDRLTYDVGVVGGGPAGLTTALYTTRLGHRTALFEKEGGRHAAVSHVHNLVGVSEDVSGSQLAELAVRQLEEYGADVYPDDVETVARVSSEDDRFRIEATHSSVIVDRVVFATGFTDNPPEVPGLRRFTGRGLHYCLHCDAYTLGDGSVFVLGHDDHAAQVAMTLLNVTDDVDLLLDATDPDWDDETESLLAAHPVDRIDAHVVSAYAEGDTGTEPDGRDEPRLGGFAFGDGTERDYTGGFAMYGREYNTGLAVDLGCACTDEGAIDVDDDRETSVDGVYAVGDVTHGQNQTTIAIGDAAYAGIAIHKDLRRYPLSMAALEERAAEGGEGVGDPESGDEAAEPDGEEAKLEAGAAGDAAGRERDADPAAESASSPDAPGDLSAPAAPADLRARMRRVRRLETHAGLRAPTPDR